jgi:membrane dipeptidase
MFLLILSVHKFQKVNKGVLMMNFWSQVMRCDDDWKNSTMDDLIRQIVHVRNLIGVDHIGMGADYEGVGEFPIGLEDVSTYPNLFARLLQQPGWTIDDIKKIAGLNILRVMKDNEDMTEQLAGELENDETLEYDDRVKKANATECKTIQDNSKVIKSEE